VNPGEWFFKAHFFQDPVQPGSLGIEALCQLLQFMMLHTGMGDGMRHPRFEPLQLGRPLSWKYRGQVTPANALITTELEILERGRDERGVFTVANAWLSRDVHC
jgi:3-hydroxymyristoyl/3-hydroxydecanoyl-(acyl carrier protein) dehydratase